MEKRHIKRVPVVRGGKVVVLQARRALPHALARLAGETRPTAADDQTIRERLMAEIGKQRWAPAGAIDITVRNGVVDLWGSITEERTRAALIVAAETPWSRASKTMGLDRLMSWKTPSSAESTASAELPKAEPTACLSVAGSGPPVSVRRGL